MSRNLRQAKAFIYLYVAAMLVLYGWVLIHAWRGIAQGLPDFTIFYTAGTILRTGHAPELYDNNLQKTIQQAVTPVGLAKRGSILPYNHPAFEAVLFVPLSRFSYLAAYLIWVAVNVVLLAWLALLMRKRLAALCSLPVHVWLLAIFTFDPIFIALLQGQDSILLLSCFILAYLCFWRGSEFAAGIWLGLALFKFNLVLPFVLPLILMKRNKFAAGFLITMLALLLFSVALVGWQAVLHYPEYLWATEQDNSYLWNSAHANQPNLRGLSTSVFPDNVIPRTGLLLVTSAIVFCIATLVWQRVFYKRSASLQSAYAAGLMASVLLSFHLYLHDLSLLLLAIVVAIQYLSDHTTWPRWTQRTAYSCLATLSCSPLYLLLTLRFKQLQCMAAIILLLFAVLAWEVLRARGDAIVGAAAATNLSAS